VLTMRCPADTLIAPRGRYVTVNADAGRALFYVLAESERSPADDPLVLWLNGVSGTS